MEERYCINPSYIHRQDYIFFDDTPFKDEWQNEVYQLASFGMHPDSQGKVLDIGCGSGFKLLKYFGEFNTIGVEINPTLAWLKEKHPNREWFPPGAKAIASNKFEVIICSDVIEHLEDPEWLLNYIAGLDFRFLFFSTPDRSKLPEDQQLGPPVNKHHMREWTAPEFHRFVSRHLNVRHQLNLHEHNGEQQLLICTKKPGHC